MRKRRAGTYDEKKKAPEKPTTKEDQIAVNQSKQAQDPATFSDEMRDEEDD